MEYDIIATLGPSSDTESMWKAMCSAGVTGFRLNTSHMSLQHLDSWLDRVRAFSSSTEPPPRLILDLQGSKWRLGHFASFDLTRGERVELVYAASADGKNVLPVPHPDFFRAAALSSGEIVLNDARSCVVVESAQSNSIKARVTLGGEISPGKGITYASSEYRKESLNEKDRIILEQTRHLDSIQYALSYVKDAMEMAKYREHMGRSAYVIAKLERKLAVQEATQIARFAEELWLCRGDLGAELGVKAMAETVHRFSHLPGEIPVPVLLAGQVLEHMAQYPAPTRSEVCYLYDALVTGYRGFVLSDETAVGRYPLESCRMAALFREA